MSHMLHVFPLISLHELMLITDAYQWNAHDHFKQTIPEYKMLSFSVRKKFVENNNSLVVISLSKAGENEFLQTL